MSNSSMINILKNKIIKMIINDAEIVAAIDGKNIKNPDELINTYIFDFHQNPYTIEDVKTFLTIQVHIHESYGANSTFVKPSMEIWIISHFRHMKVDNIPKITSNRNDYISELLDKKLNGLDIGYGGFKLSSNIEGSYQEDYLWRKMIFYTNDLNVSLCKDK